MQPHLLAGNISLQSGSLKSNSGISAVDDGEQVLVDVEGKDFKHITQHVKKILGKTE